MATYYVSASVGNDRYAGTSANASFATLQQAANHAQAGDTVEVMSGTYSAPRVFDVLDIRTSGTASAPITFEAAAGQQPVIDSSGNTAGVVVEGASYITIKGFEVRGDSASLNQSIAQADDGSAQTDGKGIAVWASNGRSPTHVTIEGNTVHDEPGAGIWAGHGDYVSILGNTTYNNAFWSNSADSGISVGWMQDSDSNATSYKTIVSGNASYNNHEYNPWVSTGTITDGNGIIVDSDDSTGYKGRTLVSNNVAYDNGGTGMHSFFSSNVDFFNNTAYANNQTASLREGQITAQRGTNIRLENNIMAASPGGYANGSSASGILYDYNLYSGVVRAEGAHDITGNPGFVSAEGGNFALQAGSPAIDAGTTISAVTNDIAGNGRPSGGAYDLGAYEYQGETAASSLAPAPSPSPASTSTPAPASGLALNGSTTSAPVTSTLVLNVSETAWQGDAQFTVAVDGQQVGSTYTATSSHAAGQSQAITLPGIPENMTAHDIAVSFINDAYGGTPNTDRNLFIDSAQFDGLNVAGAMSLYSNGTVHFPASAPANWLG